jgi:hypothetical protein
VVPQHASGSPHACNMRRSRATFAILSALAGGFDSRFGTLPYIGTRRE